MSDGDRAIWNEMQRDAMGEAPDFRVLWEQRPKASRPHLCSRCHDEIPAGARYESVGLITDGVFEHLKYHAGANSYPSGCPRIAQLDRVEIEQDNPTYPGHPMERSER